MAEDKLPQFAEDEDMARARAFWNENGKPIVFGIAIGLAGIFGYNYWNTYQNNQGEAASIMFEQIRGVTGNQETAQIVARIKQEYPGSIYAILSAFYQAREAATSEDYAAAISEFTWVLENSSDQNLNHIARLRLAALHVAQENHEEALESLAIDSMGSFESRYLELRGDAYLLRNLDGDRSLAKQSYEQSIEAMTPGSSHTSLVQLKLDNVGDS